VADGLGARLVLFVVPTLDLAAQDRFGLAP
jgi:hypothetical protein